ncbi:cuticle protein CP14.6-like [Macrobrachium nipponense]|uniref:cuticle protein CP14.6-like n=1 Tax=Macrobrachium nipponense TaxID=159736 RepID=UPI0030C8AD25
MELAKDHHIFHKHPTMKFVIISAALAVVAFAAPQYGRGGGDSSEEIPILRDDRDRDDFGRYSVNVETANGIELADAGTPDGPKGTVVSSGFFSYTSPEGVPVEVKYVANENGFQPQFWTCFQWLPNSPTQSPKFVLDLRSPSLAGAGNRRGSSSRSSGGYN